MGKRDCPGSKGKGYKKRGYIQNDLNKYFLDKCVVSIIYIMICIILQDSRAFVMAVCELSGQMLVYDEETYGNISEDEIVLAMGDTVQETYSETKQDVMNLFLKVNKV